MTELKRPNPYYANNKITEDSTKISRREEQGSSKATPVPPRPFPGKRV